MKHEFRHYLGIDWSTGEHAACLLDEQGELVDQRSFANSGDGLDALISWLRNHCGKLEDVATSIEVPHGPVVATLLDQGIPTFTINPKQSDRFRDRFSMAGAKDDRFDARVLASAVMTDSARLRRLNPEDPAIVELREWTRIYGEERRARTTLVNRVDGQLLRYFPAMRDLFNGRLGEPWTLAIWELAPNPKAARKCTAKKFAEVLKKHRIRKFSGTDVRKALLAKPVTVAAGTNRACEAHIKVLAQQLALLNRQLKEAEATIDRCLEQFQTSSDTDDSSGQQKEQRDAEILLSLPGVGRIVAATLLGEGSLAIRDRNYAAIRSLCGVAPVTRSSGAKRGVVMRKACNSRLRDAVYHWSRVATQVDSRSKAKYAALRRKGHSHGRALRTIGDRLLRVAIAMLRDRRTYDASFTPDPKTA